MKKNFNIWTKLRKERSLIVLFLYLAIALIAVIINSDSLASATDIKNIYKAPFEHPDYLLGTDGLGRSVFYGLINGAKVTIFIATITSFISLILGLILAFFAAYFGNDKLKLDWLSFIGFILSTILCCFYFTYSPHKFIWLLAWLAITVGLFFVSSKSSSAKKKINIPIDTLILKFLEVLKTLPGIFIVLFFLSLFSSRSVWNVILLITVIRVPIIIRLGRSEILKLKTQEYFLAAEGMGLSTFKLFFSHIIPNIITPIRTYLVYGLAATVLVESVLSFLGLGLPLETVTWGSMLSSSRQYFSAWWLAVFPGLAIFFLVYSLRYYFTKRAEDQEYFYI